MWWIFTPTKKYSGEVAKIVINVEQPFHFKNLFKYMHDWLEENNFGDRQEGKDRWEKYYLERVGQVKEYVIDWDTVKYIGGNKYYRYALKINFHLLGMKKIEVMEDGKKLKLDEGELKVTLTGKIETDYEEKWKNHWLLKKLKDKYDQKIFHEELQGMHEDNLYRLVYELQALIKDYLKQRCVTPPEGFLHTQRK